MKLIHVLFFSILATLSFMLAANAQETQPAQPSLMSSTTQAPVTTNATETPAKRLKDDKDGDGYIDEQEFLDRYKARFAEIDTNHDGHISPDELKTAQEKNSAASKSSQPSGGLSALKRLFN